MNSPSLERIEQQQRLLQQQQQLNGMGRGGLDGPSSYGFDMVPPHQQLPRESQNRMLMGGAGPGYVNGAGSRDPDSLGGVGVGVDRRMSQQKAGDEWKARDFVEQVEDLGPFHQERILDRGQAS